ncbi:hypothetical protein AMTR_s00056p00118100 [Amborella trichopoda]|uniref:Uncharacterized protein n=1 Tax=Amborella trichopoda TaxID=13333 RepID=U5CYV2_AMBTC|nr:hypothetical protein AMTR_s00056p00118100 [Amborella trichopoda]
MNSLPNCVKNVLDRGKRGPNRCKRVPDRRYLVPDPIEYLPDQGHLVPDPVHTMLTESTMSDWQLEVPDQMHFMPRM